MTVKSVIACFVRSAGACAELTDSEELAPSVQLSADELDDVGDGPSDENVLWTSSDGSGRS